MSRPLKPDGLIYRSIRKHRIRFLIAEIILILILVSYFIGCFEYISNVFTGPVDLDVARFAHDSKDFVYEVEAPFDMPRDSDSSVKDYAVRKTSYWQDDKYEFSMVPENVREAGIKYTAQSTGGAGDAEVVSAIIYSADIGGVETVIIAYPDYKIEDGKQIDGIFTAIPFVLRHDLSQSDNYPTGTPICGYMLDTRGLEMESESFDITFCVILLAIILILAVKLVIQFADYRRTPTYLQLEKYGEPDAVYLWIDSQLEAGYKEDGKRIITEDWILEEDVFKLRIVKNHMKPGKFSYTGKDNK